MFMINFCTKFHTSNYSGSLIITTKPNTKYRFWAAIMLPSYETCKYFEDITVPNFRTLH